MSLDPRANSLIVIVYFDQIVVGVPEIDRCQGADRSSLGDGAFNNIDAAIRFYESLGYEDSHHGMKLAL